MGNESVSNGTSTDRGIVPRVIENVRDRDEERETLELFCFYLVIFFN